MAVAREYVEYLTVRAAMDRSEQLWTEVLGRPKNPRDTTQFFLEWIGHPDQNRVGNKGALVVPQQAQYINRLNITEQLAQRSEVDVAADGWLPNRRP